MIKLKENSCLISTNLLGVRSDELLGQNELNSVRRLTLYSAN